MKRLRNVGLILLAATAIAGCSAIPGTQTAEVVPSALAAPLAMPAKSCVERSADAIPPKNPIVELVWCIAETDELYDPSHLFQLTLGMENYEASNGIAWGVQAASNAKENPRLPKGIRSFLFVRKNPERFNELGDQYLSVVLDPKVFCVRMSDVVATFGEDSWLSAIPIAAPSRSSDKLSQSSTKAMTNPYGIFYKSPRLFMKDASGSVDFNFQYEKCVKNIGIQRKLDFISYRNIQQERR